MKKKMKLRKKIALIFLIFLMLGAGGVYGFAVYYFSQHFYEGSRINGMNCSNMTVQEVKTKIVNEINKYALVISEKEGGQETITAEQIQLQYIDDNTVDELMKDQNSLLWFLSFGRRKDFDMTANTTYNEEAIVKTMENLKCFDEEMITKPQDAYVRENETSFEIIPEVVGNQLDEEKATKLIRQAIDGGKTKLSFVDEGVYQKPAVYQDNQDLIAKRDSLNKLASTAITYDFGADRKEEINWTIIKTWIAKDQQGNYLKDESGQYALNSDLVAACISGLAEKYDTYKKPRKFQTRNRGTVTLTKGAYGWQLDQGKMTEDLYSAVVNNVVETKEAFYSHKANSHWNNDLGDIYIEISIEEQHMWCYKNGKVLVETDVVTGNVAKGWDTPSGGVWTIFWHVSPHTLKGEVQADGKPEYEVPVTYWMPFNGGVGIHDLVQRTEYGGDIYKTSGSHGCVNTPFEAVKTIYNAVTVGTPVVVY